MKTISFALFLLLASACGKIEQVQESFIAMSGNNDLVQVEVRIGSIYRNDPARTPTGYDYINFENTQYRLGSISTTAAEGMNQIPRGQEVPIYFKGTFGRRSGISNAQPSVVFDVIDLEAVAKK